MLRAVLISVLLASGWASAAFAAEMLPGPYRGTVERVVDGDTLAVRVNVWLQQDLYVLVRVRGIDAPEMRGRCEGEKLLARDAAAALAHLVAGGPVVLTRIEGDRYFGRVLADVANAQGENVGDALLASGMARQYAGKARGGWCEIGGIDDPQLKNAKAVAGLN